MFFLKKIKIFLKKIKMRKFFAFFTTSDSFFTELCARMYQINISIITKHTYFPLS